MNQQIANNEKNSVEHSAKDPNLFLSLIADWWQPIRDYLNKELEQLPDNEEEALDLAAMDFALLAIELRNHENLDLLGFLWRQAKQLADDRLREGVELPPHDARAQQHCQ